MDKVVSLTQDLVKIDSSDPGAYEFNMGDYVFKWLHKYASNANIEKEEVLDGRFNIRAVLKGKIAHPSIIFICHMDTVVLGEDWRKSTPLSGEIIDDKLYGRGSCDMKAGLAGALSAFADISLEVANGRQLKHDLIFIGTVDEEDFMRGVEKAIDSNWISDKDWVLDTEPTNGEIRMAHKGRAWFELTVNGVTAHASTPEQGADAIFAIAEVITRLKKEVSVFPHHEKLGNSSITFGMIEGGYRPYVVPDHAKVWIDLRLVPPLQTKNVLDIIRNITYDVEKSINGIKCEIKITGDRPPIEENPNSELLAALKEAALISTGTIAKVGVFPGYTDTAVIAGTLNNLNSMSYGPGKLELAHKPDENVDVCDITRCYNVLKTLIHRNL
ncbi:MAG: M20 family metallopeptidase [Oscillospiraceae bacterium]|nr:M20 family metallopeptidase [Oscillospiraceae bacterium]